MPICKDLEALKASAAHSDVTLVLGEQEYSAHKAILAARSPVFSRIFLHGDSDRFENNQNRVKMPEMSEPAFQELLTYLYTDKIDGKENCMELFMAADEVRLWGISLRK